MFTYCILYNYTYGAHERQTGWFGCGQRWGSIRVGVDQAHLPPVHHHPLSSPHPRAADIDTRAADASVVVRCFVQSFQVWGQKHNTVCANGTRDTCLKTTDRYLTQLERILFFRVCLIRKSSLITTTPPLRSRLATSVRVGLRRSALGRFQRRTRAKFSSRLSRPWSCGR